MNTRPSVSRGIRYALALLMIAAPCLAAGPSTPSRASPKAEAPAEGARAAAATRADRLPSSVLDPSNAKIRVTSTDSSGNCPNGATKLDKCSGVYPNGNSWEISPCCRTVTD